MSTNELNANHYHLHSKTQTGLTFPKESVYWQMFFQTCQHDKWQKHIQTIVFDNWLYSYAYLELLMKRFKVSFFDVIEEAVHYDTHESLQDYIKGWLPCMATFTKKTMINQFLQDVSDLAWQMYPTDKDGCHIPYTKLSFVVYK